MKNVRLAPNATVDPKDLKKFEEDLTLVLTKFPAQTIAEWIRVDKGNFSKKLSGLQSISNRFILKFYTSLKWVIARVHQGATAQEIYLEMATPVEKGNTTLIEFIVSLKKLEKLVEEQGAELVDLREKVAKIKSATPSRPSGKPSAQYVASDPAPVRR